RRVDLMRNSCSKPADGLQLLRLRQLRLEFSMFGNVEHDSPQHGASGRTLSESQDAAHPQPPAVGRNKAELDFGFCALREALELHQRPLVIRVDILHKEVFCKPDTGRMPEYGLGLWADICESQRDR